MNTPSLTERLAAHLLRPVAESNRQRARLHLLDWMACVAGARQSEPAKIMARTDGEPVSTRAAFLGNFLEMDDVHRSALLHPGPVIWPTVLVGDEYSLTEVLDAAVRGYEAVIAIGATLDEKHYSHFHNTATAGVFGAAAASASLLECDVEETVSALGLAGSVTGGLWQMRHEPGLAKQWHVAHAVTTGGSAAFFARHGMRGPRYILEGPQGLYAATVDTPRPMELKENWRIEEVSFKPWAACRHAHPAIDAALQLKARGALSGLVRVETYRDALTFCDRPQPATSIEAKFSLQHAVGVVAARGAPTPEDFELEAIADPAIRLGRALVDVVEAEEFTARYPCHFGARVSAGGESITLPDTLGDPERPLGRDGVIRKAEQLSAWGGLSSEAAERGVALALEGDDVSALMKWLVEVV